MVQSVIAYVFTIVCDSLWSQFIHYSWNAISLYARQGQIHGGLWGLETPIQSVSYSKVNTSINYFTGAVQLWI